MTSGTSGQASSGGNNLLGALREADFALIKSQLRRIDRPAGAVLYEPGDDVRTVYFPCAQSIISFMVMLDDGRLVEIGLVGREGAVGGIVSQGRLPAYARAVMQVGGPLLRIESAELERAKSQSLNLRHLFARYADCLVAQIFQSVACNAAHTIEQRTAKWLLAALDRTGDENITLTQEQLATMLAVGRSYIGRVIHSLRTSGAIETKRGRLRVSDANKLEMMSCNCNAAVKRHFETVLTGVYPTGNDVGSHGLIITNGPAFRP
jgi:CRP-like cAMP-binding protein